MKHCYLFASRLLLLLLVLWTGTAHAQAPVWQSFASFGQSARTIRANASVAGSAGEIYVVGTFSGTATFGSTVLTSVGGGDIFVARWNNTTSTWAWAQQAGGSGNDSGEAIALNGTSLFITGSYAGTTTFGSTILPTTSGGGAFAAKLNTTASTGIWAWAQGAAGTGRAYGYSIAVSGTSVYVGGYFFATCTFGSISQTSEGVQDGFVAKLIDTGTAGVWTWAQRVGSTVTDVVHSLTASGTSVYITGETLGVRTTYGNSNIVMTGSQHLFVAKLTDLGVTSIFTWVQQTGGSVQSPPSTILVSGSNVYIAGFAGRNVMQFGGITITNPSGNNGGYVVKLLDAGSTSLFVWAHFINGGDYEESLSMALNGADIYISGDFHNGTCTFGNTILTTAGSYDVFVAKLVDTGPASTWVWAQRGGGPNEDDANGGVVVSSTGTIYVSGLVELPSTFGTFTAPGSTGTFALYLATLNDGTALSTAQSSALASCSIYPNPAHGSTTIQIPALADATNAVLRLTDALGRVLRTVTVKVPSSGLHHELSVAGLAPGMYVLRVQVGSSYAVRQLMVE